jgi:hypothetical protein
MSSHDSSLKPAFGPRFSLLTVLLVMTIAGLSLVIWRQWREVGPLRAEVRRLRNEVGELSIDDRTKVYAIRIPTKEPLSWKWRVWLPDATGGVIHFHFGEVARDGFPDSHHSSGLGLHAGEHVIELKVFRDPVSGKWKASCAGTTTTLSEAGTEWFTGKMRMSTSDGVGIETVGMEPGKNTLVLMRHRVALEKDAGGPFSPRDFVKDSSPAPGFIIWLERP